MRQKQTKKAEAKKDADSVKTNTRKNRLQRQQMQRTQESKRHTLEAGVDVE